MLQNIIKWLFLLSLTSILVGSAAAGFLWLLDTVTNLHLTNPWLLYLLPILGGLIGMLYFFAPPSLANGNAFILDHFLKEAPKEKSIHAPIVLAPLVLLGTLLTHLGGGSAGREGTAVQMGASIAHLFNKKFQLDIEEQRLLTCIGMSAGFAGVFGTPFAAAFFAIEFFAFKKTKWFFIMPCLITAYAAHWTCLSWGIQHAHYQIQPFHTFSVNTISWVGLSGIIFGLSALLFIQSTQFFSKLFAKIKLQPIRPIVGGILIATFIIIAHQGKMTGLGLETINDAFVKPQGKFDFLIKLLLTSFTLSAGFKGGEVTPLFFIGAVLGSVLIAFMPLPISLLAGLGLVAVFAGATHCIISAVLLGTELFGFQYCLYIAIACSIAYLFSGSKSIYEGRPIGKIKNAIAHYFF